MLQARSYIAIFLILIDVVALPCNAEVLFPDGFTNDGTVIWYFLPTNANLEMLSLSDWNAVELNDTLDSAYVEPQITDIFKKRKHKGSTEQGDQGVVLNAAASFMNESPTLPSNVTNWSQLQLTTPLDNGNNQPKRYRPAEAVPDILIPFSNYVQIVTPSNGVFFNPGSPFRPRTELSELSHWTCSSPNAQRNMTITMIIDQVPDPSLARKVAHAQLHVVLQLQTRIINGNMTIVMEVNGRWTNDGKTWVISLSKENVNMLGKKFTASIMASNGKIYFSYQDEADQRIPVTQIFGINTAAAGSCKYSVGNYLLIYVDARNLPVQYAISRLYKISLTT